MRILVGQLFTPTLEVLFLKLLWNYVEHTAVSFLLGQKNVFTCFKFLFSFSGQAFLSQKFLPLHAVVEETVVMSSVWQSEAN